MNAEKLLGRFFTGINYWGSKDAIRMWENYDRVSVEEDFKALSKAGVTHLRVFPLWPVFQPLKALYTSEDEYFELRMGEESLPDTEAGQAGVSEEACLNFENFCDLADQYELKLVVGLFTGHMSFREFLPPAFEGRNRISDPLVVKWQLKFAKYFVKRFRKYDCIVGWDLGNEVNNVQPAEKEDFYVWCAAIADAIRISDPERPVISGMCTTEIEEKYDNLMVIRDTCDIHTCHPYNMFQTKHDPLPTMKPVLDLAFRCQLGNDIARVPTFVQEFGAIGYVNCSKKAEADFYRACLYTALTHDCHGAMWWCAFDQGHHRYAPYDWNNIGSDYGFFDKDRKIKPVGEENIRFQEVLTKLPNGKLPPHQTDAVVLIPRDRGNAVSRDVLRSTYILAKQANMDVSFSYAMEKIPDAALYILPLIGSNQAISGCRLDEIMEKVEKGAVLYISLGDVFFRQLPFVAGVDIAWRECACQEKIVQFQGEALPLTVPMHYEIERAKAEVLARDEKGNPIFFVHSHGKGKVYLLLAPLEAYLAERQGAFYRENEPPYHLIYREIAKSAHVQRRADSDHPFVRITEHPIDDNSAYISFINYSHRPENTRITLREGKLTPVIGAAIKNGILSLANNDGAIYLWKKA